jgi:FkbM family methyltransferase
MIIKLVKYIFRRLSYVMNLFSFYFIRVFHDSIVDNIQHCSGHKIKFYSPSFRSYMRSIDAHQKELMTRLWIEKMKPGETLWDIGANVGVFSLLAACREVNVVAFEPLYSNYFVLAKNIEINSTISSKITALPIALSSTSGVEQFYIPDSDPGYSGSSYGLPIDHEGKPLQYNTHMNMFGIKGDDLIGFLNPPLSLPTHIKLDVDGIEDKILQGLENVLSTECVRSVLVESSEVYKDSHDTINEILKTNGFLLQQSEASNPYEKHPSSYNYIFTRK